MKVNIGRIQSLRKDGDPLRLNLSLQVGRHFAQILQWCGIQSIRSEIRKTLGADSVEVLETRYFDYAPQEILAIADAAKFKIAEMLASFGIVEASLVEEKGDGDTLKAIWSQLVGVKPAEAPGGPERDVQPDPEPEARPSRRPEFPVDGVTEIVL